MTVVFTSPIQFPDTTVQSTAWLGTASTFFSPGTAAQVTQIVTVADVLTSLNNTYFNVYSALDNAHYVVWYNVAGLGTDPMIGGTTSVEVDIALNDSAANVAAATFAALNLTADFSAGAVGDTITAINGASGNGFGASTDASDGAVPTGFAITTTVPGSEVNLSDTGTAGMLRYDNNFFYVCVATNTWKRKEFV